MPVYLCQRFECPCPNTTRLPIRMHFLRTAILATLAAAAATMALPAPVSEAEIEQSTDTAFVV